MKIEPLSQCKLISIYPKDKAVCIVKRDDYESLTNEVDKVVKGEELIAGVIGAVLGIFGTTLVFAYHEKSLDKTYLIIFAILLIILIILYILLYYARRNQGETVKQCLRKIVSTKNKNP